MRFLHLCGLSCRLLFLSSLDRRRRLLLLVVCGMCRRSVEHFLSHEPQLAQENDLPWDVKNRSVAKRKNKSEHGGRSYDVRSRKKEILPRGIAAGPRGN